MMNQMITMMMIQIGMSFDLEDENGDEDDEMGILPPYRPKQYMSKAQQRKRGTSLTG